MENIMKDKKKIKKKNNGFVDFLFINKRNEVSVCF